MGISGWNSKHLSCTYDDIPLHHIWPTQQNYRYLAKKKDASDQPISAKRELMVKVFNFQKVSDSSCCVKTFHSVCSNNRKHSTTPLLFPKDGEGDLVSHMKWRKLLPTRLCSVGYDLQFCTISYVHALGFSAIRRSLKCRMLHIQHFWKHSLF